MIQNRFKSPVVWGTVLAQVLAILVALQVITPTQSQLVNDVIVAVLQMFVAFGILNNPTTPDHF
ncbi:MAG: hypothetical protein GX573_21235 [Chloroflexi bacterium]|nr:hypothetical protein [Chloroflexota bacterium]